MKLSAKRNLLVLTLVSLALGVTVVLRLRASNVQIAREVRTRAMLLLLANLVALTDVTGSPIESPLDTDNILSVLEPKEQALKVLVDAGVTVRDGQILDSWGNPTRLTILNNEACLVSFGDNGRPDSDKQDDIVKCFPLAK